MFCINKKNYTSILILIKKINIMKDNKDNVFLNNGIVENSGLVEESVSNSVGSEVKDFDKDFEILKGKLTLLRESEDDSIKLRSESREIADKFIEKYSDNRVELGKIVSWLGDTYSKDELLSILGDVVEHKGFGLTSIDDELRKVQGRLSNGFNKPEYYSNERVFNLVTVLNEYDNYIDTFESIELENNSNCLDEDRYLISPELHNTLVNGYNKLNKSYGSIKTDRTVRKDDKGLYLVVFKLLKGTDTIVYKYINYPNILRDCLFNYVMRESGSLMIHNKTTLGVDYLYVIDNNFYSSLNYDIKQSVESFRRTHVFRGRGIYPRNFVDLIKVLLQGCPIFYSLDEICKFIILASERKYYELITLMLKIYNLYQEDKKGLEVLRYKFSANNLVNYNFLSRVIFVVEDLDVLINSLKGLKENRVNQGIQKWRGQSDSLSNVISVIDNDFRKSLNRHNQYHVNVGTIPRESLIGRSKFSYQNIHLNIGNVRWNSTQTSYKPNKYFKKPIIKDNTNIYSQFEQYLRELPVNEKTQLIIEEFLWDYSYTSFKKDKEIKKDNKLIINYDLISSKFVKLLKQEESKLIDYINRSRNISFRVEPKQRQKLLQYHLSVILKEFDDQYILSVIYGRLFKIVSSYKLVNDNNTSVDVFFDLGNDLVQNYFYSLYNKYKINLSEKDDNFKFSDWKSLNENLIKQFEETKVGLGGKVINWTENLDLLEDKLVTIGRKERYHVLVPTNKLLETLNDEFKCIILPKRLPMIVKPRPYSRKLVNGIVKERLGGYLLNDEKYTDTLIIPKWRFKESSFIKEYNVIYNLINNISSVGYKINKNVLEFISTYGFKYNLIMDPSYIHPLSQKKKLTKQEYKEYSSYLNKLDLQENILGVVEVFSNIHEFFLPVRLDFRGRLYCISEYLNYQSTELAKALLLFSKPEKLNKADIRGISYLKAFGANCFGNKLDKKSWKDRITWVDNNLNKIINFKDGELINQAENKLMFTAFCFEYNRYLESLDNEKDYFETYLPIQLDATCNGYQHLSLLSLDHNLAEQLNLTKSNWEDEPKDFYTFTGVKLISYFKDKLKDEALSQEEREICCRLSNLSITRSVIKKAIMTIPYNVSHSTMTNYIEESFEPSDVECSNLGDKWYHFKDDYSIKIKHKDINALASGLKTVLGDDRFKIKKLLSYLNDIAKICANLDLFIPWSLPSGIVVRQSYLELKEARLKVFSYTKKTFTLKIPDETKISKYKQVRAFMPNLIHSLDAASLALLIDYYFSDKSSNIKNIYTIHDCFAVTANNVDNLLGFLKLVYYNIYSENNYLKQLDKEILHNIKTHYGDNCFNEDSMEIIVEDKPKLKYPSIDGVLGLNSNATGLILNSAYLAH